METARTIKPGVIVALSTRIQGGVSYARVDLERAKEQENGSLRERWETTKVVEDPEDHARATKVRSAISGLIRRVCIDTAFGLICPESKEPELDAAIARARVLASEHNGTSGFSRVNVYVLKGRIAATDEEAARAISDEVRTLIDAMSQGITDLDPKAIREAADRARKLGAVLDATQEIAISDAIKQARKAARTIVSRIEKDAEDSAIVLKDIQRGAIEKARLAFLDLDPIVIDPSEALPAVDVARLAGLDLGPDDSDTSDTSDTEAPPSNETHTPAEPESGETLAASE